MFNSGHGFIRYIRVTTTRFDIYVFGKADSTFDTSNYYRLCDAKSSTDAFGIDKSRITISSTGTLTSSTAGTPLAEVDFDIPTIEWKGVTTTEVLRRVIIASQQLDGEGLQWQVSEDGTNWQNITPNQSLPVNFTSANQQSLDGR